MIIRNKFNGYINGNNRLYPGGGGQPTESTQYTTNIPEYAEPYVKDMLESAQRQIYTYDAGGKKTGFKPFQSFSQYDIGRGGTGESVAGFTPMQRKAMQGIAGYQLPGQTKEATDLAGYAGLGSLGAGQQYQQMATDPSSIQAYMSPYAEAALAPQLREAERRSNIQGQQNAAQAVQQGAFGGSRAALVEAERQRNLGQLQSDIYGTGMQNAFQAAQQAQQFGAELGLQGYGKAAQTAGLLGELGQQQYGQELGLLGKQMEVGKTQQDYEQARLNQVIQDYATSQQYPFMQMGILNSMLRGLPMQAATTQMYQAQPTTAAQFLGTAGALYNLNKPTGQKEGGTVKEMAAGGIASGVDPEKLPYMAKKLGDGQLQAKLSDADTDPETKGIMQAEADRRAHVRKSVPKMASGGIIAFAKGDVVDDSFDDDVKGEIVKAQYKDVPRTAPSKPQAKAKTKAPPKEAPPPAPAAPSGYEAALARVQPTLDRFMAPSEYETELGGLLQQKKTEAAKTPEQLMQEQRDFRTAAGVDTGFLQRAKEREAAKKAELIAGSEKEANLRKAQAWAMFASTPGPFLVAGMKAVRGYAEDLIEDERARKKALNEIDKVIYDIDKADYLEKSGMAAKAYEQRATAFNSALEISNKIATIRGNKEKAGLEVVSGLAGEEMKAQSAKERDIIQGEYGLKRERISAAARQSGGAGGNLELKENKEINAQLEKFDKRNEKRVGELKDRIGALPEGNKYRVAAEQELAGISQERQALESRLTEQFKRGTIGTKDKPAPTAAPTAEDITFTAKKYGISEDEVKKRLGIK